VVRQLLKVGLSSPNVFVGDPKLLGEADGLLEDFNQMPVETAVARTI